VCPEAGNDDLPTDGRNAKRYICDRMIALSSIMDDLDRNWAARWNPGNDFPGLFDVAHRFMVDVQVNTIMQALVRNDEEIHDFDP
jgi:hypothetical protein